MPADTAESMHCSERSELNEMGATIDGRIQPDDMMRITTTALGISTKCHYDMYDIRIYISAPVANGNSDKVFLLAMYCFGGSWLLFIGLGSWCCTVLRSVQHSYTRQFSCFSKRNEPELKRMHTNGMKTEIE